MNFKKIFLPSMLVLSVLALASLPALAGHHGGEGKSCPMSGMKSKGDCAKGGCAKAGSCKKSPCGGGSCGMSGKDACASHASSPCPIAQKFCKKVCWVLEHKEELGLSDEQVARIKALDLEVEKNSIRGMAEMQIFALEIENRLSQDVVDVQALESMIDSGMAGMALGAKATIKAYAELKSVATPEQKAKAKELYKAGHAGHHHHKS